MRAVVVGAGLAGLVAADELVRDGMEVVVLEARSRVGGRVWSQRLPNGAVIEMGAEYILPGNTAIRELADRFGLGLWDKGMRYGRRDPRGGTGTNHEELAAAVAKAERALEAAPKALRVSASDFLESLDIPPGAREAILARVEISSQEWAARRTLAATAVTSR
jgi:monoamine oxidase